jgi:hypothetical protein
MALFGAVAGGKEKKRPQSQPFSKPTDDFKEESVFPKVSTM